MTRKSWLAMTGLCILLATSAAQAHPITLDAVAYAPTTAVSEAYGGISGSHVTSIEAALRSDTFCWQMADGESFSASMGSTSGNCLRQKQGDRHLQSRGLREGTLDRLTDVLRFDSTQATNSASGSAFATPAITRSQSQQLLSLILAAGKFGRSPISGSDGHSIGNGMGIGQSSASSTPTNVPEPATLALMMMGLIGVAVTSRARRRTSN